MVERITAREKEKIKVCYSQQRGSSEGTNAQGEPLADFNLFAETPRAGARNAIERWMVDLPAIIRMGISSKRGLGVTIVG